MNILIFLILFNQAFSTSRQEYTPPPITGKSNMSRIHSLFDKLKKMQNQIEEENKEEKNQEERFDPGLEEQNPPETLPIKNTIKNQPSIKTKKYSPSSSKKDGEILYTVLPGDSLLLIARKFYNKPSTYLKIMEWNKLTNLTIYPSQKLILKNIEEKSANTYKTIIQQKMNNLFHESKYKYIIYKVKNGDSLSKISLKFLGSTKYYLDIAKLNKIQGSKYLFIGQKLIIPIPKN